MKILCSNLFCTFVNYVYVYTLSHETSGVYCTHIIYTVHCKSDIFTVITLIIRTIQLFEHPPFSGKLLIFCIPSIRTPTFEISIPMSEHLCSYTSRSSNGGRRTSTGLRQFLRSYSEGYRTSTRLLLSLRSSNGGC